MSLNPLLSPTRNIFRIVMVLNYYITYPLIVIIIMIIISIITIYIYSHHNYSQLVI